MWALGAHLVGQAVCDPVDERHRGILPPGRVRRRRSGGGAAREPPSGWPTRLARPRRSASAGERVHGLVGLAPPLLVPAERLRRGRARVRGLRRALGADPRRVRSRRRALRPRGASHRDRLRLRHHPQDARRGRPATRRSGSTSTRATSPTSSSTPRRSRSSSPTGSTTSTSRTRSGAWTAAARSSPRT